MKNDNAIELNDLCKEYRIGFWGRKQLALDHLSFSLRTGEILGYLGHNGSGKTTTFKAILGLIQLTSGSIQVFGQANTDKSRRHIGFLPENPYFYMYLTAQEALHFQGCLKGMQQNLLKQRIPEVLKLVDLSNVGNKQLNKFSRGMLQRIGIAQCLINDPPILILDEPMSGLDPIGRRQMRDIILRCRDQGKSVIFSSHILPDVEMLCDRAIIIKQGKLQGIYSIKDIVDEQKAHWEISCADVPDAILEQLSVQASVTKLGTRFLLNFQSEKDSVSALTLLINNGCHIGSYGPYRLNLEDIYTIQ